jgi:hypothetical protein
MSIQFHCRGFFFIPFPFEIHLHDNSAVARRDDWMTGAELGGVYNYQG